MLLDFIFIVLSFTLFFIGIKLLMLNKKRSHNTFLALFVFCFANSVLYVLAVKNLTSSQFNIIILLPLNLIFFPIYFIINYINTLQKSLIFSNRIIKINLILSLAELCTYLMPLGAWLYTQNLNAKLIEFIFSIKHIIMFIALIFGLFVIIYGLKKTKKKVVSTTSDKLRTNWVEKLIFYLLGLLLIVEIPEVMFFLKLKSFYFYAFQCIAGSIIVCIIGIKNISLERQIDGLPRVSNSDELISTVAHFNTINELFREKKIYQNAELRISEVADLVSLSPNYVSKIINENSNVSFNDFVNEYRVKEVIEKFNQNEHFRKNIVAIAKESGFNSKSTFQSVFKKKTGKTPTEYIKSQINA